MPYGTVRADTITWDNGGTDTPINLTNIPTTNSTVTFTRTQSITPDDATSDTTLDMSLSNFINLGSANPTGQPTNLVVGTSGIFYCQSAAPSSWHEDFLHPGGEYSQPSNFPALAPWYISRAGEILVGAFTEFSA